MGRKQLGLPIVAELPDCFGIWLAARRPHKGLTYSAWMNGEVATTVALTAEQFGALVTGLPWQNLAQDRAITVV